MVVMLNSNSLQRCKSRLALSFIVKDEGKYAIEMLASVAEAVGFVCFADTGSSDNTVEIISDFLRKTSIPFTMKSISFTNFGAARNAAIDLVPPEFDWILMLDCDEIILSENLLELQNIIETLDHDAWRLPRFNWDKEMWGTHHNYPDFQARLFRNWPDRRIRYTGEIHEQLQGYTSCGHVATARLETEDFPSSLHLHHIKLFRKSAEELHNREVLYQTFYQKQTQPEIAQPPVVPPAPIEFIVGNTQEVAVDTGIIRKIHSMSLADYDLPQRSAYWCEWNHVNEQSRRLTDIVAEYVRKGWAALIRPGATCIDIGAHSGDTSLPMGIFSSDFRRNIRGRVYAFEPNPDLFPVLNLNLSLNTHFCDFIPINMAVVRERNREITIADHGNGNCNGGIIDENFGPALQQRLHSSAQISYVARGVNLSAIYHEFLTAADRRNLEFIKISASGYDKEILRSSKDVFDAVKPVIFVDWFDMFSEEDSIDLFRAIDEIDYTAKEISSGRQANAGHKVSELVLLPKRL